MNTYFTKPIITIGLLFVVQLLHSQINVDKTRNDTAVLEQKDNFLKDITVNASIHPDLVISAYVRNYSLINDSLYRYLDAMVDYVIPENAKKGTAKTFLKQYRVYAQKITPQKKRWIQITPGDVGIPRFYVKSVLDTQRYSVLPNNTIVFKKYPDSVVGSISLKDSLLKIKIDRPTIGDTSVHDFLGYRIQFLRTIREEMYKLHDNNFKNRLTKINDVVSKHNYQKFLLKHKKESDFKVVEYFSDIIVINAHYIDHSKVKSMQSLKLDREKNSYQTSFWKDYMHTLPKNIMEMLENTDIPDFLNEEINQ